MPPISPAAVVINSATAGSKVSKAGRGVEVSVMPRCIGGGGLDVRAFRRPPGGRGVRRHQRRRACLRRRGWGGKARRTGRTGGTRQSGAGAGGEREVREVEIRVGD